ncbi:MAG TPA: hypothetical protein VNL38_03430 [Candidatus Nitrosotenuis sp.]|nr:hypothetical protein [Candidatus Nitrosotenuis sp.]
MRSLWPTSVFARAAMLLFAVAPAAAQQDVVVPQTALSTCPALSVVSREEIPAGSLLGVSPDGRWLARLAHTTAGAEIFLRDRDAPSAAPNANRMVTLESPPLPPGVAWRVHELRFAASGALLVVRSLGAVYVISVAEAKLLHRVTFDQAKQTYPGRFALGGAAGAEVLAVAFWPAESALADAATRAPVEIRLLDAASGRWLRSLLLPLNSSDAWSELALSPDASRLAVLLRATRWPGKARLALYAADSAQQLWQTKVSAEDLLFSADGSALLVLGSELHWLSAANGKPQRKAEGDAGPVEFQRLRVNAEANLAVGRFARYSRMRRALNLRDAQGTRLLLWRLDSGRAACDLTLAPALGADVWPTARGEIIALEETFELRPPLRLLKSAQIVTYRVQ